MTDFALLYVLDEDHKPIGLYGTLQDAIASGEYRIFSDWLWGPDGPEHRRVAQTRIEDWWVSTVFLGVDHSWGTGPPVLFETMVFWEGDDPPPSGLAEWEDRQERYCTWAEAVAGHEQAVADLTAALAGVKLA